MSVEEKIATAIKSSDPDPRHADAEWLSEHPSFVPLSAEAAKEAWNAKSPAHQKAALETVHVKNGSLLADSNLSGEKVNLSGNFDSKKILSGAKLPQKDEVESSALTDSLQALEGTIEDKQGYKSRTSAAEKARLSLLQYD